MGKPGDETSLNLRGVFAASVHGDGGRFGAVCSPLQQKGAGGAPASPCWQKPLSSGFWGVPPLGDRTIRQTAPVKARPVRRLGGSRKIAQAILRP